MLSYSHSKTKKTTLCHQPIDQCLEYFHLPLETTYPHLKHHMHHQTLPGLPPQKSVEIPQTVLFTSHNRPPLYQTAALILCHQQSKSASAYVNRHLNATHPHLNPVNHLAHPTLSQQNSRAIKIQSHHHHHHHSTFHQIS